MFSFPFPIGSLTLIEVNILRISYHVHSHCSLSSLWIGERDAYITIVPILELTSSCESVSEWLSSDRSHTPSVNHFSPVEEFIDTALLVTDTMMCNVWSNVYPGR